MSVAVLKWCNIFHRITECQFELLQLLLPIRTQATEAFNTSMWRTKSACMHLNVSYTCAFPCIVLSSIPWWLFRPLNTAGKSLRVSTSLQSTCSSTPGTGITPWPCGNAFGPPTSSPFRWKSKRCFSPSASLRLLKVTVPILPSRRRYRKLATERERNHNVVAYL